MRLGPLKFRLQNDVISPATMLLWACMVGAATGPIWIKSPFWIIPYGILALFMGLLTFAYVVMLATYKQTIPIMLSKYENKLTRKSFYEYVACACCAFLLLLQGNWFAGGLALSATVLGILWRALLTHEHKKYRRTLH